MTWLKSALALMLGFIGFAASAANLDEIRKQTRYSMDLTGWLDIDGAGMVTAHGLDQDVAKLPPSVVSRVAQAASGWRFATPTPGVAPAATRAPMRLRMEARRNAEGYIADLRIAGAGFGQVPPVERVTFAKAPSTRAIDGYRGGVSGNVHLVVRVGRDGKPMQVVAEQVNLTVVDSERGMARWRGVLANFGIRLARQWRFIRPTAGRFASRSDWTVRIPVRFFSEGRMPPELGQWDFYIPGPRQEIPWDTGNGDGVDVDRPAMANDIELLGSGLRLLTSLDVETPGSATPDRNP